MEDPTESPNTHAEVQTMEVEDLEEKPVDAYEKSPEPASEKPTNHYTSVSFMKSSEPEKLAEPSTLIIDEPPPIIVSASTASTTTKYTNYVCIAINTIVLIALVALVIVSVVVMAWTINTLKVSNEEMIRKLNASIQERIDQAIHEHSLQVEADLTHLRNLYLILESGNDDLMINISLLDFAKLVEDIQANFTLLFDHSEGVDTYLQELTSSTDASLMALRRNGEKLSRNVTRLEDAAENIEGQLVNLAAESNRNAAIFTSSLANVSADLAQLELDTTRDLARVNTTLHQETQAISERLTTFRTEAHSLVNRSIAEVFVHIENEVTKIRAHIDSEVSEVRGHIDSEVSELRGHINAEVSELRNHIASQVTEVRGRITRASSEARMHTDNAISDVRDSIDTKITGVKRYVDNKVSTVNSGATTLQSIGLLVMPASILLCLFL